MVNPHLPPPNHFTDFEVLELQVHFELQFENIMLIPICCSTADRAAKTTAVEFLTQFGVDVQ